MPFIAKKKKRKKKENKRFEYLLTNQVFALLDK